MLSQSVRAEYQVMNLYALLAIAKALVRAKLLF